MLSKAASKRWAKKQDKWQKDLDELLQIGAKMTKRELIAQYAAAMMNLDSVLDQRDEIQAKLNQLRKKRMSAADLKLLKGMTSALQDAYYWAQHETKYRASCKGCDPSGEGGDVYGELAAEYKAILKKAGADVDRNTKRALKLSKMMRDTTARKTR